MFLGIIFGIIAIAVSIISFIFSTFVSCKVNSYAKELNDKTKDEFAVAEKKLQALQNSTARRLEKLKILITASLESLVWVALQYLSSYGKSLGEEEWTGCIGGDSEGSTGEEWVGSEGEFEGRKNPPTYDDIIISTATNLIDILYKTWAFDKIACLLRNEMQELLGLLVTTKDHDNGLFKASTTYFETSRPGIALIENTIGELGVINEKITDSFAVVNNVKRLTKDIRIHAINNAADGIDAEIYYEAVMPPHPSDDNKEGDDDGRS